MLTIATPNTERTLLTTAELRAAAGVSDSSQNATLSALNGYVSAVITKACRIPTAGAIPPTLRLESVVETIRLRVTQDYLPLARRPVVTISSLTEDDSALAASEYENDGNILYRLTSDARSYWSAGEIVVAYDAGYATVPDDLKYAAIKFVQAELQQGDRDPMLKRKSIVGVSDYEYWVDPTRDTVIPPDVWDILARGGYVQRWGWMA